MPPHKTVKRISVKSVDPDKSKIKFTVTLTGELDWNKDFANRTDKNFPTMIDEYDFRNEKSFKQALINYLWGSVSSSSDNIFNNGKLTLLDVDQSVVDAYSEYHSNFEEDNKAALRKKIEEEERRLQNLKKQLDS